MAWTRPQAAGFPGGNAGYSLQPRPWSRSRGLRHFLRYGLGDDDLLLARFRVGSDVFIELAAHGVFPDLELACQFLQEGFQEDPVIDGGDDGKDHGRNGRFPFEGRHIELLQRPHEHVIEHIRRFIDSLAEFSGPAALMYSSGSFPCGRDKTRMRMPRPRTISMARRVACRRRRPYRSR